MSPPNDGSVSAANAAANTAVQTKFVKFHLPDFNRADPETWFVAVEIIFKANKVDSDDEKFSYILQHIDSTELSNLRDILVSTAADKYVRTKERLIQVHGKSRTEQLTQLLQGASIPTNCKPSVTLQSIKNLAGAAADSEDMKDIILSMWLQRLPTRTREILAPSSNQSLAIQAEIADRLYVTYESSGGAVAAISSATTNSSSLPVPGSSVSNPQPADLGLLLSMLTSMQAQISAIAAQQEDRSRSRNRSPTPHRHYSHYRSRSRGSGPERGELIDGVCWYHRTFGTRARGCAPDCKMAGNQR